LDITVALKETFSADHRLRRQFAREARLLARLDHPALPRVIDYFTESNRAFIVMQFIPGPDLANVIARKHAPFTRKEVITWADQLLDALVYLHAPERQIVHRDIKPHNLKLTAAGQITLLDFGLAKSDHTETSLNSKRSVFGFTPRYSPPEQIQDLGTTPRSDIYALGATLYHLCTGVKPPDAMTRISALADGQLDPLIAAHQLQAEVGAELAILLNRAMALNPDDRHANATDFRDALLRVDYSRWAVANEFALAAAPPKSANTVSVVTTVAAAKPEPRRIVIDNLLDNNSILRPYAAEWLLPEPNRMPLCAAALFGFLLLFFFGLRSSAADWFLGDANIDVVKQDSQLTAGGKPPDGSKSVDPRAGRKGNTASLVRRSDRARRTSHR
jgi:serine/threonine protein kinase